MKVTEQDVKQAVDILNKQMVRLNVPYEFEFGHRYDYYALDKNPRPNPHYLSHGPQVTGTKAQVYAYVTAVLDGIDLAGREQD